MTNTAENTIPNTVGISNLDVYKRQAMDTKAATGPELGKRYGLANDSIEFQNGDHTMTFILSLIHISLAKKNWYSHTKPFMMVPLPPVRNWPEDAFGH